jgi:hypothetical protein
VQGIDCAKCRNFGIYDIEPSHSATTELCVKSHHSILEHRACTKLFHLTISGSVFDLFPGLSYIFCFL